MIIIMIDHDKVSGFKQYKKQRFNGKRSSLTVKHSQKLSNYQYIYSK